MLINFKMKQKKNFMILKIRMKIKNFNYKQN